MPFISADEFTNPILKKIASGDELVFLGATEGRFNLTERYQYENWSPLSIACNNNHISIVNRLMAIPEVVANAAARDNQALRWAAREGCNDVVSILLEIPEVVANAAAKDNCALLLAIRNGLHDVVSRLFKIPEVVRNAAANNSRALLWAAGSGNNDAVSRLLEIPAVVANAAADDNHALRWAAGSGHYYAVRRLLEIPEVVANTAAKDNFILRRAAQNGHNDVVSILLEIPEVVANAAAYDNSALCWAAKNGHDYVVSRLLEISEVVANAVAKNNYALCWAAKNGHDDVVSRLLEIPEVVANAAARDNDALRCAAQNGHNEVAYVLAKSQWPKGGGDMPNDLHGCLPAIYQGALMVSGEKEFEGMVKCWARGKPISTTSDVHYPRHDSYSKNLVRLDMNRAPRFIMQYARCRDVATEAINESRVENGMNTLLYSSRLHKTFQSAYEEGQKESKKRAGYGEGAMVIYTPGNRNSTGM